MAWQQPKTDWVTNPKNPVAEDFNRIEGNITFLKQDIETKKGIIVDAINYMNQPAQVTDTHAQLASKIRDISKDATAAVGDVEKGKTFYAGGQKRTGTLELTGNATAADVLSGKTFYNTNLKSKVTGTMPNRGAVVITPSASNQTIQAGYHNGQGYVKGDANLKSGNIKAGVSIFGVQGNVAEGRFFQQYLGDIPASGKVVTFPFNPDVVVGAGSVYSYGVRTAITVDGVTAEAGQTENNRLSIVIEWGTNTARIKGRRHLSSGWVDYEAKNVTIYAYKCK